MNPKLAFLLGAAALPLGLYAMFLCVAWLRRKEYHAALLDALDAAYTAYAAAVAEGDAVAAREHLDQYRSLQSELERRGEP